MPAAALEWVAEDHVVAAAETGRPALVVAHESRLDPLDASAGQGQLAVSWFPAQDGSFGWAAIVQAPALTPGGTGGTGLHVDLGVHWRQGLSGRRSVGVQAWRRLTPEPDAWSLVQARQPSYGARVEVRWAAARRSGLVADYRFIGLQLQSGARITLRRTDGRPTLYYRLQF